MGEVLQCLETLEIPFNINNKQELNKLVELGFDLGSTTFSNPIKLGSHIRAAQSFGVNILYCDSVEELAKIKKFHGSARYRVSRVQLFSSNNVLKRFSLILIAETWKHMF